MGDLYPPGAYQYSDSLKIRFKSHVLPSNHGVFKIMSAQALICYELHGPCPLEPLPCCGRLVAHVPCGTSTADLQYVPDVMTMTRHMRACMDRMVRERPHGIVRRRAKTPRSGLALHVGDHDNWGSDREVIPLLGINDGHWTSVPKSRDSQGESNVA